MALAPEPLPLAPTVDVVLPVWGAAAALARCLRSVAAHTDLRAHRLRLALDGPQPAAVEDVLAAWTGVAGIAIERGAERRGYPATVNRALAGSRADAVLLNSDVIVTARWIEKLRAAAGSAPDVASATPFSNDAAICSLPRFLARNALPDGWDVDRFAALVEERTQRAYPRLPTGVGMCLYVKRAALDRVGVFDADAFGLGYGEENDWCMRAAAAGYAHVLDDATFVFHEGQQSFGRARKRLARTAMRVLRRRHPAYLPAVARFMREDPIAPLRARVTDALRPRRPSADAAPAVLHLAHGWPPWNHAGVEQYAWSLAVRQAERRAVTVYARIADPGRDDGDVLELLDRGGVRVRLVVNGFTARNPIVRNAIAARALERDFARLLDETRPALVHVHHLAGLCASLVAVAARRRIPIVYHLHDWWTVCARANMLDRGRRFCAGPSLAKCAWCVPMTRVPPARLWSGALHALRRAIVRRGLRRAAVLVVGSAAIEASLGALGGLPADVPIARVPYGVSLDGPPPSPVTGERPGDGPLRVGLVGSMMPHKGVHVAVSAFGGMDPAVARLDVWGAASAEPGYTEEVRRLADGNPVHFHARFAETDKRAVLSSLDLLVVPSLGLESFGLVVDEAMACGVPVVAARRGALADRLADCGGAALVDPERPEELRAWIERLARDRGMLAEWRRRLPVVRTMDEHAAEIEALYARVLAERES